MRHWMSGAIAARFGETFPWGTLAVNILGSIAIGVVAGATDSARIALPPEVRQFFMVGLFGGFTTFSSFSLQTLRLFHDGDWMRAGANIGLSLLLCLAGVAAGYRLARIGG